MNKAHWMLTFFWLSYCIIHSVMADIKFKERIKELMGIWFIYYRPLYSVFSAISLVFLLWFQFSFQSLLLFRSVMFFWFPGIFISAIGLTIMLICIHKYFYELSGLEALQHFKIKNTLQQSGLHKYVRHPLYLGTLLFVCGLFLIFPFLNNLIAALIITTYVLFGIALEEKKLKIEYGESYKQYSKKVPKIIPFIFK